MDIHLWHYRYRGALGCSYSSSVAFVLGRSLWFVHCLYDSSHNWFLQYRRNYFHLVVFIFYIRQAQAQDRDYQYLQV